MEKSIERQAVIVFVMVVAIGFFYRALNFSNLAISPPSDMVKAIIGGENFTLEVADSRIEQVKGLSDRSSFCEKCGMLFVFDKPGDYGVWMKDMRFPIDIFWLDENYCVVDSKINVSPKTFPEIFRSSLPAQYIVELPAKSFTDGFSCINMKR